MFNNIELEYPYFLLIILIFILCAKLCKQRSSSFYFPHINILNDNKISTSLFQTVLKWSIIIFALIALSSPIEKLQTHTIKKDGFDIVLNLDTSGSMRQFGFNPNNPKQNRWEVVSELVKEFIDKRVNDNIALVVFGSAVMKASPLSFDKNAQQKIVDYLNIGVVGDKTALLDSIASSINMLQNSKSKSKILITLTDGDDTASKIPLDVVEKLIKKHDIKVYMIGIGESNKIVLNKIAKANDGKLFTANSKDDLKNIYETINTLEKSEIEQNKFVEKKYYFFYPLFISVMSLILFLFLRVRTKS